MAEDNLKNLIKRLSKLPGLGPRSAQRAALSLIKNKEKDMLPLSRALYDVAHYYKPCVQCNNLTESDKCSICDNPRRHQNRLCVVEDISDLLAIERSGVFQGKYFVLKLVHGDIFCTDDSEYQKFKEKVRSENWKKEFLSKSLEERKKIAENLRKESSLKNSQKQDFLMDVNKSEIKKIAEKSKIDLLIHGHVHRPKVHKEDFGERIVLGDWDKKYWYIRLEGEEGSLLSGEIT